MVSVGIILLVHENLGQAKRVAQHWLRSGCCVVVHVDARVPHHEFCAFAQGFAPSMAIAFSRRVRARWGTWALVDATLSAADLLLAQFPECTHALLTSGACLPLRSLSELENFLSAQKDTDFIESVSARDVDWIQGGLQKERFSLRFPFAWRQNRRLFDVSVALQRKLGVARKLPTGLQPHLGSQWWCLTGRTLRRILDDPRRVEYETFFRSVWIPDESYFQTLARHHALSIQSQSLTYSRFDEAGRPYLFYDDHYAKLQNSGAFLARKIWPGSHRLYETFLSDQARLPRIRTTAPRTDGLDHMFDAARDRQSNGRSGLRMQSRCLQAEERRREPTQSYSVFSGYADVFEGFPRWLAEQTGATVHGKLFDRNDVQFAGNATTFTGGLTSNSLRRDYDPDAFLSNLIWNMRGTHQCFQFSPTCNTSFLPSVLNDRSASLFVISGAWAIALSLSDAPFVVRYQQAIQINRLEAAYLHDLQHGSHKAGVKVWTLANALRASEQLLRHALETTCGDLRGLAKTPPLADVQRLADFLVQLRNAGLPLKSVGNIDSILHQEPAETSSDLIFGAAKRA